MNRRSLLCLLAPLATLAGCSKPQSRGPGGLANRPKGPQGFGNMMAKEWTKDLASKSPEKRTRAARELANMGPAAKSALPALQKAAQDTNKDVAQAAKQAIAAIRK
jgi:hypothetical protein